MRWLAYKFADQGVCTCGGMRCRWRHYFLAVFQVGERHAMFVLGNN